MSIRIEGMDGKDRQVSGDYWKVTEVGSLQIFKKSESYSIFCYKRGRATNFLSWNDE